LDLVLDLEWRLKEILKVLRKLIKIRHLTCTVGSRKSRLDLMWIWPGNQQPRYRESQYVWESKESELYN